MMASFPNKKDEKGRKRSVSNGLSALALGSVLTTGGVAAGAQVAASAASQLKVFEETEPEDQVRLRSITQLPTRMKVQHISWVNRKLDSQFLSLKAERRNRM